tara:strand:- start:262 stop:606 length:345 start_codon:yes stop_codon:yes gene_type:complete
LDKKHAKGTASEFAVSKYFAEKGYYIFTSITSSTSPIDLIAINPETNDQLFIDVKTFSCRKTGKQKGTIINRSLSDEQKKLGVKIVYCYDDGTIRFRNKRKTKNSRRLRSKNLR